MFKKLINYVKFSKQEKSQQKTQLKKEGYKEGKVYKIEKNIEQNLTNFREIFKKTDDIIFREFSFGLKKPIKAFVCYVDGLGDKTLINEYIIKPLLVNIHVINEHVKYVDDTDILTAIKKYVYSAVEISDTNSVDKILDGILSGDTALFIDGYDIVLIISSKGGKTRAIEEPGTELTVRGPRDGFTEELRVNTSLLRRKIKNTNLVFESLIIGKQTHTDIAIAYIDGIANEKIIEEIKKRLSKIDADSILDSGYIEQFIEDNPLSLFATIGNSERPDKIAAKLLEGRVAIICNGTPYVLTVPYLFIETIQVSEDYYSRPYLASFVRLIRLLSVVISLVTPAFFVAFVTFHQEMVPTILLQTMAAAREGIPFPSFVETMIMMTIFEILRESGVRLPRQVGQAVSIVGALVIGDAAVKAGIISAPMVIIGALTGITSFIVTPLQDSLILFRFFLLILSAAFGLFGIVAGIIIMLGHICSLRSFGTPYFAPIAPTVWKDLKDSAIRAPLWLMKTRSKTITWRDSTRQGRKVKPHATERNNGGDKK